MQNDRYFQLNGKLVMIRAENSRFYVHVEGTMFPNVYPTFRSAMKFARKIVKTFKPIKQEEDGPAMQAMNDLGAAGIN